MDVICVSSLVGEKFHNENKSKKSFSVGKKFLSCQLFPSMKKVSQYRGKGLNGRKVSQSEKSFPVQEMFPGITMKGNLSVGGSFSVGENFFARSKV